MRTKSKRNYWLEVISAGAGFGLASYTRYQDLLQKKLMDGEFGTSLILDYRIKSRGCFGQLKKAVCKKGKHGFRDWIVFGSG